MRRLVATWTEARSRLPDSGFSKGSSAFVGWIVQHPRDRGTIPNRFTRGGWDSRLLELPLNFANGRSFSPDPIKNLANDWSLFWMDFITGLPIALLRINIMIAIMGTAQGVNRPLMSGMTFTPSAPF